MLQKIDLDKIINDQDGEEKDTKKVIPEYHKDLNVAGYHTLVCLYNDLTDYIEKYRDLLLKGCKGLINAQEEARQKAQEAAETLKEENNSIDEYIQKIILQKSIIVIRKILLLLRQTVHFQFKR